MDDLISRESLYEKMVEAEDLARQRVIDTPSSFPGGALNPAYIRYLAQVSERTRFKELIYDEPPVDAVEVVRCKDCKSAYRAEVYSPSIRCEITNCILTTEDYCSLGERKAKDERNHQGNQ